MSAMPHWKRLGQWMLSALACAMIAGTPSRADDGPKPSSDAPAVPPRHGPGVMLTRLSENLSKLDLAPDQKSKTDALLADVRKQLMDIRDQAQNGGDGQALAKKARELLGNTRSQLQEILTPDQQEKLRDLMQQSAAAEAPPAPALPSSPPSMPASSPPSSPADTKPKGTTARASQPPAMHDAPDKHPAAIPAPPPTAAPAAKSSMIDVGQPAPDFTLKTTAERNLSLASYKGKVVVLVFGSYSTPSFRERVPAMEKLAKDYGTRASVVIVYTREAHAVGEWEVARNKDENISVEQPKTDADRRALAQQAITTLKITLPVVIDGMDDATTNAYGVAPNGAVVIGRDGAVASRQHWFEPIALRQQIDAAVAAKIAKE